MLAFVFSGCDDNDVIWDISPVNINLRVVNEDGVDLLDRNTEGNILGEKATLVVNGVSEEYVIESPYPIHPSRYYLPMYYGLALREYPDRNVLAIGEWDGMKSATYDIQLTILGKTHEIKLVNKYQTKHGKPDIKREEYIDGKLATDYETDFKIVL